MSENMKASGIAWIGDIPESWSIKRVKYLATLKGRIGWQGLTSDEYTDEGPYLITGIDFENGKVNWDNCVHISRERWEEATEIQIQNGDLLITKDGTVGKVAIVSGLNDLASLNSGVLVIRTNSDFDRRFLFWVLQSEEFWVWFRLKNAGNSTIIHLYQNDFAEFCYTYPKTIEQTLIADFLDEQCEKIDSIATDIEKQIEILQKYKKSIVTETVTKGLDKSVSMKDSRIEWIGVIPEHWKESKIKFKFSVINGSTPDSSDYDCWDGNIKWITPADMNETGTVDRGSRTITDYGYNSCGTTMLPIGSIVISSRAPIGKINITSEQLCTNQGCKSLVSRKDNRFFYYLLLAGHNELVLLGRGTTFLELSTYDLSGFKIVIPSEAEQTQIADYLDKQCTKIDSIIESKKEQLTKITQHKKSLIYEYVTGKKRVKEAHGNGN